MSTDNDDPHRITKKYFPDWSNQDPDRRTPERFIQALREHERKEFAENEKRFDTLEHELAEVRKYLSNLDTGRKVIFTVFTIAGSIAALVIAAWPLITKH